MSLMYYIDAEIKIEIVDKKPSDEGNLYSHIRIIVELMDTRLSSLE